MPGPKSFRTIMRRERRIFTLEPKATLTNAQADIEVDENLCNDWKSCRKDICENKCAASKY